MVGIYKSASKNSQLKLGNYSRIQALKSLKGLLNTFFMTKHECNVLCCRISLNSSLFSFNDVILNISFMLDYEVILGCPKKKAKS